MTPRHLIAAIALAAASAHAQSFTSDSTITFSLHWTEHNGNNNGVLEPGESAVVAFDVSFTNQNGIATFSPPIGTFGAGTVRGFGGGFLDLHGHATSGGNARGTWNLDQGFGYGVDPSWQISEQYGEVVNGGNDIIGIQFGQFVSTPQSINTTNPVMTIWSGLWTPESYAPRTVTFSPTGAPAAGMSIGSLWLLLTATIAREVFVSPPNLAFDSVAIPIVPAPASALLIAALLPIHRRSRGAS
jgi:hypothetical protein